MSADIFLQGAFKDPLSPHPAAMVASSVTSSGLLGLKHGANDHMIIFPVLLRVKKRSSLTSIVLILLQRCLPLKLQKCFVDSNTSPTPSSA